MRLGVHTSIGGGLSRSLERAKKVGCESMQVFTSNPKGWQFKVQSKEEIFSFKEGAKENRIEPVFGHAIYLTNFASNNPFIYTNSINSLISGLVLAHNAGFAGVITHIGSGEGRDAKERVVNALKQALGVTEQKVPILLETDAGSGSHLGYKFEEVAELIKMAESEAVRVCFDTCHVFAAGYDLTTPSKFADVLDEFDRTVGINKLACFHLNDSKGDLGSRVDRHEEISKGKIGLSAFEYIVNEPRFSDLAGIVETPDNKDTERTEKLSLDILKELRK